MSQNLIFPTPSVLLIAISIQMHELLYSLVTCLLLNPREVTAELQRIKHAKKCRCRLCTHRAVRVDYDL